MTAIEVARVSRPRDDDRDARDGRVREAEVFQTGEVAADRMLENGEGFRYALVVTAGFRLRESAVTGYVVIVLTVQSLKRLLDALDRWQRIQG